MTSPHQRFVQHVKESIRREFPFFTVTDPPTKKKIKQSEYILTCIGDYTANGISTRLRLVSSVAIERCLVASRKKREQIVALGTSFLLEDQELGFRSIRWMS